MASHAITPNRGRGLAVLRRWRLHPGIEASLAQAWAGLSDELLARRSLGSRLHRGPEGIRHGCAHWPGSEARSGAFALPSSHPAAGAATQQAGAERFPQTVLEPASDLVVLPRAGDA